MTAILAGLRSALKGRKTILTALLGIIVIIANARGFDIPGVDLDAENWLSDLLIALAAIFMRVGIANK